MEKNLQNLPSPAREKECEKGQEQNPKFPNFGDLIAFLGIVLGAQIVVLLVFVIVGSLQNTEASAFETLAMGSKRMALYYLCSMSVALFGILLYAYLRKGWRMSRQRKPLSKECHLADEEKSENEKISSKEQQADMPLYSKEDWFRFSKKGLNPLVILWGCLLLFATGIVMEPLLNILPEPPLPQVEGWWGFVMLVVMAPVMEELICRGAVLGSLRQRYGTFVAWFGSALFFGLIHLHPTPVVYATMAGVILGYVYIVTSSLWCTMILHAFNNGLSFFALQMGWENFTLSDLVGNSKLYLFFYILALILFVASAWRMYWTVKQEKKINQNLVER